VIRKKLSSGLQGVTSIVRKAKSMQESYSRTIRYGEGISSVIWERRISLSTRSQKKDGIRMRPNTTTVEANKKITGGERQ